MMITATPPPLNSKPHRFDSIFITHSIATDHSRGSGSGERESSCRSSCESSENLDYQLVPNISSRGQYLFTNHRSSRPNFPRLVNLQDLGEVLYSLFLSSHFIGLLISFPHTRRILPAFINIGPHALIAIPSRLQYFPLAHNYLFINTFLGYHPNYFIQCTCSIHPTTSLCTYCSLTVKPCTCIIHHNWTVSMP